MNDEHRNIFTLFIVIAFLSGLSIYTIYMWLNELISILSWKGWNKLDQALGVAGTIGVKQFSHDYGLDDDMNKWLKEYPYLEIIDIKFSVSANAENWVSEALIIYRKEG